MSGFQNSTGKTSTFGSEVAVRYLVNGLNVALRSAGHVFLFLIFEAMPNFPIPNQNISTCQDRTKALRTARGEVANIRAEQRIKQAVKQNILHAAHCKIK